MSTPQCLPQHDDVCEDTQFGLQTLAVVHPHAGNATCEETKSRQMRTIRRYSTRQQELRTENGLEDAGEHDPSIGAVHKDRGGHDTSDEVRQRGHVLEQLHVNPKS